ncbi:hypothetical protein FHY30_002798 [Xanthomonas arboricola]|jgi:hypothetical protein|nr:hypothetical protein [Xanthomonas campestris]MCW2039214.1 hypothetical protein [Xanthomonas campestris]
MTLCVVCYRTPSDHRNQTCTALVPRGALSFALSAEHLFRLSA